MTYLDDELAEATDALLYGRGVQVLEGENRELQQVVQQLYQVIDPQTPPSAEFEQRLLSRLDGEWNRAHAQTTLRLLERPLMRVASLAAAVVLVLGALLVLAVPDESDALQGAAVGFDDAAAILVLLGVAGVWALVYWRSRRG